jgi:hypothetical protein
MALKTITATNSVFQLGITGLYNTPQLLKGYSADAAFETEGSEPTEIVLGVDGIQSAGFVPFNTKMTISIMPDSDSNQVFEDWLAIMKSQREVFQAFGLIVLPSIRRKYTLNQGVLTSTMTIPGTKKVLQAKQHVITWGSIDPSSI